MGDFLATMYALEKEYGGLKNIPEDEPRLLEARRIEQQHHRAQAKELAEPVKNFNEKEESKIVKMYNADKTADEIADRLGADKLDIEPAIKNLRKKGSIGVNNVRQVKKQALKDRIKPHYAKGLNYSEIAKEVGVSQPTVSKYVKEMIKDGEVDEKYSGRNNSYSKADDEKIMDLREQGQTFKEIGEVLNRTQYSIAARYKKLRIKYDLTPLGHAEILKRKIIPLYEKDLSYSDIAVETNRSKRTVAKCVNELIVEGRLKKRFEVDDAYRLAVIVKETKKSMPTVVEIDGAEYVLRYKE